MDFQGFNACFTCGVRKFWKELQCGHYVSRQYLTLRYDGRNCHPQCYGCNIAKKGNLDTYAINLMNKYGEDILRQLDNLKYARLENDYKKFGVMQYSEIIIKYKNVP